MFSNRKWLCISLFIIFILVLIITITHRHVQVALETAEIREVVYCGSYFIFPITQEKQTRCSALLCNDMEQMDKTWVKAIRYRELDEPWRVAYLRIFRSFCPEFSYKVLRHYVLYHAIMDRTNLGYIHEEMLRMFDKYPAPNNMTSYHDRMFFVVLMMNDIWEDERMCRDFLEKCSRH